MLWRALPRGASATLPSSGATIGTAATGLPPPHALNYTGAVADGAATRRPAAFRAALVGLTLLAGGLRFWGLTGGFPHPMTRPDEETILAHTTTLAAGTRDLGYAIYPHLYMYLTWLWGAAGLELGEVLGVFPPSTYTAVLREDPTRILAVDRVLSAMAGTAAVPLLVVIARPTLGTLSSLGAGGLLAASVLHVRDAHAVKPDAFLTLGVVVVLGLAARLASGITGARAVAVGIAIGVATGMKYPALLLGVPAWLAAVLASGAPGWRRWLPPAGILVGIVALVTFAATSPFLFLNPATRRTLLGVFCSIFPQVFPALPQPPIPPAMVALRPPHTWWQGFVYHVTFSLPFGLGVVATLAVAVALLWGALDRRALPRLAAAWLVTWFTVHGLSPMMLSRYMTPAVPAAALLLAGATEAFAARIAPARFVAPVFWLLLTALAAEPLAASIGYDSVLARTDTRVLAQRWLAEHVGSGQRVAVVGTRFLGYGEPVMPPRTTIVRVDDDPAAAAAVDTEWIVAHDHPGVFSSHLSPATRTTLDRTATLVAEFDPFRTGAREGAVFEFWDAYYIPIRGFDAVERPGPHLRVYRRAASDAPGGS